VSRVIRIKFAGTAPRRQPPSPRNIQTPATRVAAEKLFLFIPSPTIMEKSAEIVKTFAKRRAIDYNFFGSYPS